MNPDNATVSDDGQFITVPSLAEAGSSAFADEAAKVTGKEPTSNSRLFTEDDVEAIRKQEKDKLYGKLNTMEEQLRTLAEERDEARRIAEEKAKAERDELKRREEEELTAKQLITVKEQEWEQKLQAERLEWQSRFETLEQEREQQAALLERERELQALEAYRQRRIQEEQETIIPELLDLVRGNNAEEIDANIEILKQRSYAILESVSQATQQPLGRPRGAQVTAPPTGPMETHMEQQTLSADDIRNMPMDMYVQMRDRLLKARPNGRF